MQDVLIALVFIYLFIYQISFTNLIYLNTAAVCIMYSQVQCRIKGR